MSYQRHFRTALIVALVVGSFLMVSEMDYQDAVRQHALYCRGVESGAIPDYAEAYDETCRSDNDAE